jgi:hypothetical protein
MAFPKNKVFKRGANWVARCYFVSIASPYFTCFDQEFTDWRAALEFVLPLKQGA